MEAYRKNLFKNLKRKRGQSDSKSQSKNIMFVLLKQSKDSNSYQCSYGQILALFLGIWGELWIFSIIQSFQIIVWIWSYEFQLNFRIFLTTKNSQLSFEVWFASYILYFIVYVSRVLSTGKKGLNQILISF